MMVVVIFVERSSGRDAAQDIVHGVAAVVSGGQ